jgi:hypothetical protein
MLESFHPFRSRRMKPLALTPAQQRRLEKLARDAGRTPAQTLKFVLRDGFDFCEWEVRESLAAEEGMKREGAIPNEQVQRDAQRIIDAARARKSRKAA